MDGSRPLPSASQDVSRYSNATVRDLFLKLEPRFNRFGYTLYEPFITKCRLRARRVADCPVELRETW